jgi:membrane protease YdiL (CAAX protease family)
MVVVAVLWGRALWYFDERSQELRRWTFFAMRFSRLQSGEVRALLLSALYYGCGLLAALLLATAFDLNLSALISFSAAYLGLAVLGVIGEISLANLLVSLGCLITGQGKPEQFAEVKEIPWMKGLQQLPAGVVPWSAALGGVIEEVFFRGVLLRIFLDKLLVAPFAAVTIAGALFCLQQLVQVRTAFQAMVIGSGCVAISLVGGLLVVLTGSVIPAVLCHASFVVFFMTQGTNQASGAQTGSVQA